MGRIDNRKEVFLDGIEVGFTMLIRSEIFQLNYNLSVFPYLV